MSVFMNLEGWQVLDGRLLSKNVNVWDESNEAAVCLVDDSVAAHSPPAESWVDYGLEDSMVVGGAFEIGKAALNSYCDIQAEQQFHTLLSSEDSYFSHSQIRHVVQLLQAGGCGEVLPAGYQYLGVPPDYGLPQSPEHDCSLVKMHLSSHAILDSGASLSALEFQKPERFSNDDVMDMFDQMCDTIDVDMIIDPAELASFDSFLPPMSPEDVEFLLSCDSPSPDARLEVSSSSHHVASSLTRSDSDGMLSDSGCSSMDSPGFVPPVVRKKEQNKTAALRYREKKRSEHGSVLNVCDELESRNVELKTKVSEMEKEINYLKGLIAEIYS